jgi:predicted transcriptional regulator
MFIIHTTKISVEIEAMRLLSTLDDLKGKDYRVLLLLMAHIDGRAFKNVSTSQMATELKLDKDDVKKSLKRLVEVDVLEKGSSEHVKDGYKFKF